MKFNKKFWFLAAAAVIAVAIAFNALRPKEAAYKTEAAARGRIVQEVAETGSVRKGEAVNLNFKSGGTIQKINVAEGEAVFAGQILAELDNRQTQVQLAQARANHEMYNLQLLKLRGGAAPEDIAIIESQVQAARVGLAAAQQGLADARSAADQRLDSVYKSAADALSAAYSKAYNGYNFADLLQRTYFAPQDADSIVVWEALQKLGLSVGKIKNYSQAAQANGKDAGLDPVFASSKTELAAVETRLREIRAICEKTPWRDTVNSTNKDSLDLHIGYVVAVQSAFNSAVEAVAAQKSANDLSVNSAVAAVNSARAAQTTAQEQLAKTFANPRGEDVGILEAQIAQAQAQIALLELQIADSRLAAPANGRISKINGKAGETISAIAAAPLMVFLPDDPYEVFADIYEEDATKIKIGDPARIAIAALGDDVFSGRVSFVASAAKIINGVVYYETGIAFDSAPEGLLPEMTADVEIVTAEKDGALLVSENGLRKKDGGWYAQILIDGQARDVQVQIGIRAKGIAEILSGIAEGDLVIIP